MAIQAAGAFEEVEQEEPRGHQDGEREVCREGEAGGSKPSLRETDRARAMYSHWGPKGNGCRGY